MAVQFKTIGGESRMRVTATSSPDEEADDSQFHSRREWQESLPNMPEPTSFEGVAAHTYGKPADADKSRPKPESIDVERIYARFNGRPKGVRRD